MVTASVDFPNFGLCRPFFMKKKAKTEVLGLMILDFSNLAYGVYGLEVYIFASAIFTELGRGPSVSQT